MTDVAAYGVRIRQACLFRLGVSRSGHYEWASRAPSTPPIRLAWLTHVIDTVHERSRGVYGIHRTCAELVHGPDGISVGTRQSPC